MVGHHGRVHRLEELGELIAAGGVAILSGAGLSTESGIPDYRGPSGIARRSMPMTYQMFTGDAANRARYWARSHLGWRQIAAATPNRGHQAVADLQRARRLSGVITQNVDGLHTAAGATGVIELHGNLDQVVCLGCGTRGPRQHLDDRLRAANPDFDATVLAVHADGDVELDDDQVGRFRPVDCDRCGGMLKPDVVFFGENVPLDRVSASYRLVAQARLLLVLGSSLTVMSGRRFVIRATKLGVPVAIVNQGPTRGDEYATLLVDAPLGPTLASLAQYQEAVAHYAANEGPSHAAGLPPRIRNVEAISTR